MACNHKNLKDIMQKIPICQGGVGRHKCAGCAYEKGLIDGANKKMVLNLTIILNNLPVSQALPQRHKDPLTAYILGYYKGLTGQDVLEQEVLNLAAEDKTEYK